ncbi:hypothetical protein [Megamonas hypermegale]|uniref:phage protein n=1 Tax=Megamonas hypermegale TaxID=158847 RepID=UPI0026EC3726|nr:hypothetical protein [Megamonas hypermegale]
MKYWKRQYKIAFPSIGYYFTNVDNRNGLKIEFDIDKDLTKQTNKSVLKIYNLSKETRKALEFPDINCEIYAGYESTTGPVKLFVGNAMQIKTIISGNDMCTEFRLSDGGVAIRDCEISISFPPNTQGTKVIQTIASSMGLAVVYGRDVVINSFANGYSFIGSGGAALDEVCGANGLKWSIQNGVLQIILEEGISENRGIVFGKDSGLIGSPERIIKSNPKPDKETPKRKRKRKEKKDRAEKQAGWKIKTLLAPSVLPGDAVKVESEIITGWFRVEAVRHSGDSMGNDWTSEFDLIERLTYANG